MGEVYRARDTRLGRQVAIKLLPEAVAEDDQRRQRFESEARLLAALNHPNVATVHEFSVATSGDDSATPFLVMELVEGPTLADRISAGPIPLGDVLRIFEQVAAGLAAAHAKGVVHRDLKPSNVKVTQTGLVKVLDFGLAKALREMGVEEAPSVGPGGRPRTEGGGRRRGRGDSARTTWGESLTKRWGGPRRDLIVGTPGYMSPEQASGQAVDVRTDTWAFGCSLFEALTGEKAFSGRGAAEVVGKILEEDPDWELLDRVPVAIRRLLRRCLCREPLGRPADLAEVVLHLRETYLRATGSGSGEVDASDEDLENRLFDLSHDLLCIAGFDGMLKRINPAFVRVLGWEARELLGKRFFEYIHPDDVEPTRAELANLAAGIPTLYFENRYRCADGGYLRLQWTAHPDRKTGLIFAVARIAGRDNAIE